MKVIVLDRSGNRVQGAHVTVEITSPPIIGTLLMPPYNKTVTTNNRGEAYIPDPGVQGLDRVGDLSVEASVGGKTYTYYASVKANYQGKFPDEHEAVLTTQTHAEDENPFILIFKHGRTIAIAAAVIAVVGVVNAGIRSRHTYHL
jgi:hypothetical protein